MGKGKCAQQGVKGLEAGEVVEIGPSWPALHSSTREEQARKTSRRPVTSGSGAAFQQILCLVLHKPHWKDVSSGSQTVTHKLCPCVSVAKSKAQTALVFQHQDPEWVAPTWSRLPQGSCPRISEGLRECFFC